MNAREPTGRTELHYAALANDQTAVARLLASGADPSAQDANGWTPLHMAAQAYGIDATRLLIAAGADVNRTDRHGNGPLWTAVFNSEGRGEVIVELLRAGADAHHANLAERDPIELASKIASHDVRRFFS